MGKRFRAKGSRNKYKAPRAGPSQTQISTEQGDMKKAAMYSGAGGAYDYNRLGSGRQAAQAYNQQVDRYTAERSDQAKSQREYDNLRSRAYNSSNAFRGRGKRGFLDNSAARSKVKAQNAAGMKRPEITAQAPQAYQPTPNAGYNSAARNVGGPRSMNSRMANLRNKAGRSRSPASQTQSSEPAAGTVAQGQIKA